MCWIKPAGKVDTAGSSTAFYTAVCRDCLEACIDEFPGGGIRKQRRADIEDKFLLPPSSLQLNKHGEDSEDDD